MSRNRALIVLVVLILLSVSNLILYIKGSLFLIAAVGWFPWLISTAILLAIAFEKPKVKRAK